MADSRGDLLGFAYGEDLEGVPPRSLGYRLLAPLTGESWRGEVEALARRLQAAPYSDHWPPTDLFCSVLLADGRRVIALARYGLADHTPSQRRGGLELVGVVGPGGVDVRTALAVYSWLQRRRATADDLHQLGGDFSLAEIVSAFSPPPPAADPLPVLPVRLWQEGALLFAASTPSDPDHRLGLLEQGAGASWQWLPLVGPDFPLATYAQRGPVVAWTPHLAGVALKLDHKAPQVGHLRPAPAPRALFVLAIFLVAALAGLLVGNLWSLQDLRKRLENLAAQPAKSPPSEQVPAGRDKGQAQDNESGRDRFVTALKEVIDQGGTREWQGERAALLARYDRLTRNHKDLRVREDDVQAKLAVAAISVLAERSADHIEHTVRKALADKGFSERLIKAACDHVHEQFIAEIKDRP
jgi:hypothetical protein